MKKFSVIVALLAILGLVIPAYGISYGLAVGVVPMEADSPAYAQINVQPYNEIGRIVTLPDGTEVYKKWSWDGKLKYSIKCTGDYETATVRLNVLASEDLAEGYTDFPSGTIGFEYNEMVVNKTTSTYAWLQVTIPDEDRYYNQRYQCEVEIEYLLPETGGQVQVCYVYGDTVYVETPEKEIVEPIIEPEEETVPEPTSKIPYWRWFNPFRFWWK